MSSKEEDAADKKKKPHRERLAGRKAEKKKAKNPHVQELTPKQKNPKAFTFNSAVRAERRFRRTQDIDTKRHHIPLVDRTPLEPPPIIVTVVGPPKVGKTMLIRCLIKNFTKQPLSTVKGPVTIVAGKKRRITFIECNNDINSMIDIAKVADLVLLLVDASFGFEMEIFEFLNICQVHGMPRVMGVLTHLDMLKIGKQMKRTKRTLKHRFWTEVYPGAKLFYLSGLLYDEYLRNEVKNLGRFITVMKFRPLAWRSTHSYMLADRMEDLTPPELVRQNPKVDRLVSLYGYIRGVALNKMSSIHIPGCGDLKIHDVSNLPDPCPLPEKLKKRALVEKERHIYAPFSGVGGVLYDKDAVYVELAGSHSFKEMEGETQPEKELVDSILNTQETMDAKMARSELQLFSGAPTILSTDVKEKFSGLTEELVNDSGRTRRKVIFANENDEEASSGDEDSEDEDEDSESDSKIESPSVNKGKSKREHSPDKNEAEKAKRKKIFTAYESDDNDDDDDEKSLKSRSDNESKSGTNSEIKKIVKDDSCKDEQKVNRESKEQKKRQKSAIAAANSKLLHIMAEDSDESEEDDELEEEDVNESKLKEEEEQEEEEEEAEESKRYHDIGTDQDRAIRSKVSGLLSQLEKKKKKEKETDMESETSLRREKEDSEFLMTQYSSDEDSSSSEIEEDVSMPLKMKDSGLQHSKVDDGEDTDSDKSSSDSDMEEENEGQEESALKWKSNLVQKAADAFVERQATTQNLYKLVYGELKQKVQLEEDADGNNEEDVGGLFKIVNKQQKYQREQRDLMNVDDCARFVVKQVRDWTDSDVREVIRDCFVTGKWKESEDAEELLRLDNEDDEELFGDFEDLETGEKHGAKTEENEKKKSENEGVDKKNESREALQEKKRKLKEKFDLEYDDKDGEKTYFDELKQEADLQTQVNRSEFEGLDDGIRIQLEGFRPGMYVRLEVNNVPCELITNFDPTYPLVVGGLQSGEENIGFVQVRIKKHRWYQRTLKTRDPLIISLGWRRFQTLAVFSKLEDNMRNRMLKYTPEHITCMAHFWGPITPQTTGFLAVQDVASRQAEFRVAATGSVVELDKSTQIMKKLKLTGSPYKIYKKTAFIKDMFNSTLEIAKFEGARLKTVSGIRGQIKRAVSKPEGAFRATFEDKILLSDIVFCRTWYKVEVPKFYNPVTSLLLPLEKKNEWRGMKTVGQLKREQGIRSEPAFDSLYTPIEREPKVFRPLVIPRSLQKELPYKDKPKNPPKIQNKKAVEASRIAVVREPYEQKVASMMKMLKTSYNYKQEQLKQETKKRMEDHKKEMEREELRKLRKQKELRKQVFRTLGKMEAQKKKNPR